MALGTIVLLAATVVPATAWDDDCAGSAYLGYVVTAAAEPKTLEVRAHGLTAGIPAAFADTTVLYLGLPGYVYHRRAWFNLRQGEFGYGISPTTFSCCVGEAVVDERFVLGGLPAGTEVDLRVRLDMEVRFERTDCHSDCTFAVYSRIGYPGGDREVSRTLGGVLGSNVVAWPHEIVARVRAGEEFPLRFSLSQGTGDGVPSFDTSVRWSFPGLSPGVIVNSCLASAVPTPVRSATWGGLKAHYR